VDFNWRMQAGNILPMLLVFRSGHKRRRSSRGAMHSTLRPSLNSQWVPQRAAWYVRDCKPPLFRKRRNRINECARYHHLLRVWSEVRSSLCSMDLPCKP